MIFSAYCICFQKLILEHQIRIPRNLSVRAANVLKGFLNKVFPPQIRRPIQNFQSPSERLGCKPDLEEGLCDIKLNSFFKSSIDWTLVGIPLDPPCPDLSLIGGC